MEDKGTIRIARCPNLLLLVQLHSLVQFNLEDSEVNSGNKPEFIIFWSAYLLIIL